MSDIFEETIPFISSKKNYWLFRTNSGKYYEEFRRKGIIAINWNEITLEDINGLTEEEIKLKLKKNYPNQSKHGRTYSQLRIFSKIMKEGDTVVITGPSSYKFTIGEIEADDVYEEKVDIPADDKKTCPYYKRRKIKWLKEVGKFEVDMPMFKLLQHAQHTITDAMDYADVIESMVHDFFIREEGYKGETAYAQLSFFVDKERDVPFYDFFELGHSIIEMSKDFNKYTKKEYIDLEMIQTEININSPGKFKMKGPIKSILAIGLLFILLAGGKFSVQLPSSQEGGGVEIETPGILQPILEYTKSRKDDNVIDLEQVENLEIEAPKELEEAMRKIGVGYKE
ncbi:hypothetical protein GOP80_07230 [Planococcaceae bacterium Storch 2/2-2]|nr:hypothetical protein [Planococcaceae bacterium Storch 2/2-2]